MKLVKKILLGAVAVVDVAIGVVALVGALLPREHVASRSARFAAPPEAVFDVVSDFARTPSWRPELESVEILASESGKLRFRERSASGEIVFEEVERVRPSRMVVRIADPELPFGGTWTWELAADGAGTRLTLTERGEVRNPIFRFVARYVLGHETSLAEYLAALEKKLSGREGA